MYRLPLILILLIGTFFGYGQAVEPSHLQLSYTHQPQASVLPLQALFSFTQAKGSETVRLTLLNAQVTGVNLVQSRVKDTLAFNYANNQLSFKLPEKFSPSSQILVQYQLDSSQLSASPFYRSLPNGFAINALNYVEEDEKGMGQAGFFYPSPNNASLVLSLNILLPRKRNFRANGEVEFTVADGENNAFFTRTQQPIRAQDFYLLIGGFDARDDAADLDESLALSGSTKNKLFLNKLEQQIQPALSYYTAQTGFLFLEEDLLKLQNLSDFDTTNFFLMPAEVAAAGVSAQQFANTKAAALLATHGNKAQAQTQHYRFYVQNLGTAWRDSLLQKRFNQENYEGDFFWQEYLNLVLVRQNSSLSLADTFLLNDSVNGLSASDRNYLELAQHFYHRQKPLNAEVSFKYVASKNELNLFFSSPDTATVVSFKALVNYSLGKENTASRDTGWVHLKPSDTLQLQLSASPRSARVHANPKGLIILQQNRPLSYWLADLTQTENEQWQMEALNHLLETATGNLFSTVLGIALDAPQPDLQLKALTKANELNSAGRQKLEATFRALAKEAKAPAVRQLAQQQLKLLYP
jgi:hypothetical protein